VGTDGSDEPDKINRCMLFWRSAATCSIAGVLQVWQRGAMKSQKTYRTCEGSTNSPLEFTTVCSGSGVRLPPPVAPLDT